MTRLTRQNNDSLLQLAEMRNPEAETADGIHPQIIVSGLTSDGAPCRVRQVVSSGAVKFAQLRAMRCIRRGLGCGASRGVVVVRPLWDVSNQEFPL